MQHQSMRSVATAALIVPATAHSMIDDRTFSVAAARAWNIWSVIACEATPTHAGERTKRV